MGRILLEWCKEIQYPLFIQSFFYEEYSVSELDMLTSIPCSMCVEFDGYIALDNILSGRYYYGLQRCIWRWFGGL